MKPYIPKLHPYQEMILMDAEYQTQTKAKEYLAMAGPALALDQFDYLTGLGWKLDLVRGVYIKPK